MTLHLFCPQCDTYLGHRHTCACGWARPQGVTHPGQPLWQAHLPGAPTGPFRLAPRGDGMWVGYGSRDGRVGGLAAVDLTSGTLRWQYEVAAPVTGGAVKVKTRLALFGDAQGRLHALRPAAGRPAWAQPLSLDGGITAPPLVRDVRAYVGTSRGTLACVDWRNGRRVWEVALPRQPRRPRPRIAAAPVWARGGYGSARMTVTFTCATRIAVSCPIFTMLGNVSARCR